jgi:exodeoxyribonuclease-3
MSDRTLTLYSWNVNGIRAACRKGFLDWLHTEQPDILALQEIRALPEQLVGELRDPEDYHALWVPAERKGYSGVAILSRLRPESVTVGLGVEDYDVEGRTLTADYGDFVLVTSYVPNGSRDHSRVPYKMQYKADFLNYLNGLRDSGRSVIFCGDINTAHREIDLARPRQNQKTTGFLPEERAWLDEVVEAGWIDSFRALYPDREGAYSWWSQIGGARDRNVGWRLDYFFISPDLWDRVVAADIHPDVPGSDHCPVSLTLAI